MNIIEHHKKKKKLKIGKHSATSTIQIDVYDTVRYKVIRKKNVSKNS